MGQPPRTSPRLAACVTWVLLCDSAPGHSTLGHGRPDQEMAVSEGKAQLRGRAGRRLL